MDGPKRNLKHGLVELYGCIATISAKVAKMEILTVAEMNIYYFYTGSRRRLSLIEMPRPETF
jgi:hypothetical protein